MYITKKRTILGKHVLYVDWSRELSICLSIQWMNLEKKKSGDFSGRVQDCIPSFFYFILFFLEC